MNERLAQDLRLFMKYHGGRVIDPIDEEDVKELCSVAMMTRISGELGDIVKTTKLAMNLFY